MEKWLGQHFMSCGYSFDTCGERFRLYQSSHGNTSGQKVEWWAGEVGKVDTWEKVLCDVTELFNNIKNVRERT